MSFSSLSLIIIPPVLAALLAAVAVALIGLVLYLLRRLRRLEDEGLALRERLRSLERTGIPEPPATGLVHGDEAAQKKARADDGFYRHFIDTLTPLLPRPDLSVEMLAEQVGLSQSQLNRRIKAITGQTPVELIRRLRVESAHSMLLSGTMSVSEIARCTGFTSHAYFSKCYRLVYGVTPQESRRNAGRDIKNGA